MSGECMPHEKVTLSDVGQDDNFSICGIRRFTTERADAGIGF